MSIRPDITTKRTNRYDGGRTASRSAWKNARNGILHHSHGDPGTTSYAAYSYNGVGRMVVEDFTEPDVRLDYWGQTSGTYAGFDRFGRIKQQLWHSYAGGGSDYDKYNYGYDRNSNRLYRENAHTRWRRRKTSSAPATRRKVTDTDVVAK